MKFRKICLLVFILTYSSLSVAEGNGDLNVSGATITNDLTVKGLDCTTNANGGALTTNADGVVVCSDDDNATGPAGPKGDPGLNSPLVDLTCSEGQTLVWVIDTWTCSGAGSQHVPFIWD